ncbi:hypothetical protein LINGRAHAP2_LOCUS2121 [Linum grandiflorum]
MQTIALAGSVSNRLAFFCGVLFFITLTLCCVIHSPTKKQPPPLNESPDEFDNPLASDEGCLSSNTTITVFIPSDNSQYPLCSSEKPEVQIVLSRVDQDGFRSGRLSNRSVLKTCGGNEDPVGVIESAKAAARGHWKADVVDWNLYDDGGGHVVVHGIRGDPCDVCPVAAVGSYGISGLINGGGEMAMIWKLLAGCRVWRR